MSPLENSPKVTADPADEIHETILDPHFPCPPISVRRLRRRLHRRRLRWSALLACLLPGATIPAPALATPYLKVTGVAALRFHKPAEFHAAAPKAVAEGPPLKSTNTRPDIILAEKPPAPGEPSPATGPTVAAGAPPLTPPRPILSDELMPRLVPEDVLPYFQFPTVKPEKASSTATYKQQ